MRDQLRNLEEKAYWCYGLNHQDFDYTVRLAAGFVEQSKEKVQAEKARIERDYPDPSISCEVISDVAYYAWVDQQYLWQFALWRLQGILEGMIFYRFLEKESSSGLIGMKKKLEAMAEGGFTTMDSPFARGRPRVWRESDGIGALPRAWGAYRFRGSESVAYIGITSNLYNR